MNDAGQWSYYGKVGGAVTTGNEDGGKHVSAQVLYALQHIGVTIPPQSDSYWNGEAGPGDSYADPGSGGPENAWTTRNATFMAWNILHFARMLKDAGGVPAHGNSTFDWDLSMPDHPNPEYRAPSKPASTQRRCRLATKRYRTQEGNMESSGNDTKPTVSSSRRLGRRHRFRCGDPQAAGPGLPRNRFREPAARRTGRRRLSR